MFEFLRRKDARSQSSEKDRDFRIVSLNDQTITFRSKNTYPVDQVIKINLKGHGKAGSRSERKLQILVQSANFLTADAFEYTGQLQNAPADLIDWLREASKAGATKAGVSNKIFEQRRGVRAQRTFQVFSRDLQTFKALSSDISATGIRLIINEPVDVGKQLELTLNFDDYSFPAVKCKAEVVWCKERDRSSYFAGLRFTDMDDNDRKIAESYIDWVERYKSRFRA
jgi:hypothetical protein